MINVMVTGKCGEGKTRVLAIIEKTLRDRGFDVSFNDPSDDPSRMITIEELESYVTENFKANVSLQETTISVRGFSGKQGYVFLAETTEQAVMARFQGLVQVGVTEIHKDSKMFLGQLVENIDG